ncbi:SH3 domain-containing protein [Streptomyces daghestanicus]|uniref:SH3b domain-containing protein n=1 Tax=Streptomyces daghestanicus TaxID=66885 RepID=A0ABQ3Q153_9ACTN|nr:SH3 domain-containing protein [Streptomyces daghestanicus]GGU45687.1 hypothetical protein GCM10010259_40800 [Streptomyces daghestanicus]GHI30980.1 hypothetical protein Sdagh_27100 [Streptomyces daghestanicus]
MSRFPRSSARPLRRLAITAAAGALATAAAVVPASAAAPAGPAAGTGVTAGDGWGDDPALTSHSGGSGHGGHEQGRYRGIVTADRLALRTAPDRGSEIIRYAHRGETVRIHCKTGGERVQRNPIWYLLTDGTWAWGAARYIDNVGPAPRWC